ncbi:unnamed protein product [Sphagnum balticum]
MDIVPQRHWPSAAAIVHPPLRRVARGSKVTFGEHAEPIRIARTTSSMLTDTTPGGHVLAINRHTALTHSKTIDMLPSNDCMNDGCDVKVNENGNMVVPTINGVDQTSKDTINWAQFTAQCAYFAKLGYAQDRVLTAVQRWIVSRFGATITVWLQVSSVGCVAR